MATIKQREAARENIKKAQAKWQSMSRRQHSLAQPQGKERARPGSTGGVSIIELLFDQEVNSLPFVIKTWATKEDSSV